MPVEDIENFLKKTSQIPESTLRSALTKATECIEDSKIPHDEFCEASEEAECTCGATNHNKRMDENVDEVLLTLRRGSNGEQS